MNKSEQTIQPFASNDQMLETAKALFDCREEARRDQRHSVWEEDPARVERTAKTLKGLTEHWHRRLKRTPPSVPLIGVVRKHRLTRIETEILMGLLMAPLCLTSYDRTDPNSILEMLSLPDGKRLVGLRALSDDGRLYRAKLIYYEDSDEELNARTVCVAPEVTALALYGHSQQEGFAWLRSKRQLGEVLQKIARILFKKADALDDARRGHKTEGPHMQWLRRQNMIMKQLDAALEQKTQWRFSQARTNLFRDYGEWTAMLALAAKYLGYLPQSQLFTGGGLAAASCWRVNDFSDQLKLLMSTGPLVGKGYVQPAGGEGNLMIESAEVIEQTEYELTPKAVECLGLEPRTHRKEKADPGLLVPRNGLDSLVLPRKTLEGVMLALDHARHGVKLMDTWGLRRAFPYGAGATVLFHGPPGTGKTATAEAIAHELKRSLLVADYSRIQNCLVGATEKNISALFRKARVCNAVLFWDEADAMFHDRDATSHQWEVRDVNVLLQEIERFEGVCILATNRITTLDKAFERRLTAKVEFPRPEREQRRRIWRKLLPPQLPLAQDVDVDRLSSADLSGGQIKNVILNAARMACGRPNGACVTAQDLEKALAMETAGKWGPRAERSIGFRVT